MTLLDSIDGPDDVKALDPSQLDQLAQEIRDFLVDAVSRTGGHLGPNLGVVELTIALHRVFDSPQGHDPLRHRPPGVRAQAAHRPAATSSQLRQQGRPVRLPQPRRVRARRRSRTRTPPPCSAGPTASPRPTSCTADATGTSSRSSATARSPAAWPGRRSTTSPPPRTARSSSSSTTTSARTRRPSAASPTTWPPCGRPPATSGSWPGARTSLERTPVVGKPLYETLHGVKKGLKDVIAPQGMFEDLGLKYVGPIDGHDIEAVESALRRAKRFGGPVIVHCSPRRAAATPAPSSDEADRFHAVGRDPPGDRPAARRVAAATGPPSSATRWSELGEEREDVVAITAAMLQPGRPRRSSPSGSRTGSTTSASPSSTPPTRRRAWPPAGCTRSSPSTPPSSTAPSTRC